MRPPLLRQELCQSAWRQASDDAPRSVVRDWRVPPVLQVLLRQMRPLLLRQHVPAIEEAPRAVVGDWEVPPVLQVLLT